MTSSLLVTQYNPDVLSCLANLSNDEVFTPPALVNRMLDMLPQELFRSPRTRFLDPVSKTGVFLREIAKRLIVGLEEAIPDHQERINHIYTQQLYGIAITELTAMLSRRSVYCSKRADSEYSVCNAFTTEEGNIRYRRIRHTWANGKCTYCGAARSVYDRSSDLETHAYEFIHTNKPNTLFNNMKFDVIIGNPPYQLNDGGGNGASAMPIYQYFIETALSLNPRYVTMIIPARWYAGGKGLDDFRNKMLKDDRIRIIHDYPNASECFTNVQIKGGVMFFLWNRDSRGLCSVYTHSGNSIDGPSIRPLLEEDSETFIRYNIAVRVLRKVRTYKEESFMKYVSARMPFGIPNTYKGNKNKVYNDDLRIYVSGNDAETKGTLAFIPQKDITKGKEMIKWHKVFISKAGSGSDSFPHPILTKPFYGAPNTVCNESYLVIGPFENEKICDNVMSYIRTRFFRFLVLQKKNSQNAAKGVYQFVPLQDFSRPWTDADLYAKYNLSEDEIAFIESMIRPME